MSKISEDCKAIKDEIRRMSKDNSKICCVCLHNLDSHIDETDGWRCHSLGQDFFQCECFLRKRDDTIDFYDLQKRTNEMLEDTRELKSELAKL